MPSPGSLAVTAIGIILLLASCTQQQPGNASPTPQGSPVPTHTTTPDTSRESGLPAHGAPKVHNPLNISSFKNNPCQALTDKQVTKLVGQKHEIAPRKEDAEGPSCGYQNELLHGGQVKISFLTVSRTGLSAVYREKGSGYKFFQELAPVGGYPAVAFGHKDERSEGRCLIDVGVSDRQSFGVSIHLSKQNVGKKDPCEVGHTVASMVIENIKGAQ